MEPPAAHVPILSCLPFRRAELCKQACCRGCGWLWRGNCAQKPRSHS